MLHLKKNGEPPTRKIQATVYLYGVIGVCNECDKKTKDHINEEANEGIQV